MPRITKGMIAAAHRELESIRELAADSFDGPHACYRYHARSASDHIAVLVKAGQPLPDWLVRNWRYFQGMDWRGDVARHGVVEPANVVPFPSGNQTKPVAKGRQSAALVPVDEVLPSAENGTKPPRRVANTERRPREHLSRDEVAVLCKAARRNRAGARDAAAIWVAFNHGLRVSELVDLRWSDVRWDERKLMVRRLKGSSSGEHPLTEQDKRFLGALRVKGLRPSDRVFGISAAGFRKMLARLELPADLAALAIHPHMLRHACGYDMVGRADLQARAAFMGHKRLENTVRYSQLNPDQFEGLRP